MVIARKMGARYLLARKVGKGHEAKYRSWYRIRAFDDYKTGFSLGSKGMVYCPKELFGKKVRVILEFVEE